ncbi:MAG: transaldolase [Chloroflexi bacterium]|nr:MAG: transaldolase [Chloroflexota bacterium]TMF29297.1 MAG: transaldolase [Chloroflexota bacterium]
MEKTDPIAELKRLGQSVWLDQIDRTMIRSGLLARYRDAGVSGVTANPTIFARALESSDAYADEIARRLEARHEPESIVWDLLIEDVQAAADVFRPVYDREHGGDGFVSIEVSPEVAGDTERTIAAARELQRRCARPNVMVKIPATPAGLPAIQTMIADGANINVTLIFGIERYVKVVEAFLAGLEQHRARGGDLGRVHSVASFFVSRVDTKVDEQLTKKMEQLDSKRRPELEGLLGRAAIANSKLAYALFTQLHSGSRWDALRSAGAAVQRCLWASTSTKNPRYRDTMYVEELIGPATINTMPVATFEAFRDHGQVELTLQKDVDGARHVLERLAMVGIDLAAITQELEDEGVSGFAKSFRESIERLGKVRISR